MGERLGQAAGELELAEEELATEAEEGEEQPEEAEEERMSMWRMLCDGNVWSAHG